MFCLCIKGLIIMCLLFFYPAVDAVHRLVLALPEETRASTLLSIPLTPPPPAPPPPPVALGPRARLERRLQQSQQSARPSSAQPPPAPPPVPSLVTAVLSVLLAFEPDAPKERAAPPPSRTPTPVASDALQPPQYCVFLEFLLEVLIAVLLYTSTVHTRTCNTSTSVLLN